MTIPGELTIAEVYDLAAAIHPRYRALVLLGTFASLRWAELAALRPCDIDLDTCTIRVVRQLIEQLGGGSAFGPPKSRAGRRAVPFSDIIKAELADHLERLEPDDDRSCSPARWARRCGIATSTAARGCPPLPRPACPASTFTTCVMPGTPSPPMRARACVS
jgi:integrase